MCINVCNVCNEILIVILINININNNIIIIMCNV